MRRALVIAHDPLRGRSLALRMRDRGFAPAVANSPRGAIAEARVRPPDIVLIDPPDHEPSGSIAAEAIRQAAPRARVYVVASTPDDASALRAIAVTTRPEPQSARSAPPAPPAPAPRTTGCITAIGALEVDTRSGRATLAGQDLALTPREADLLRTLVAHYGAVITRKAIGVAIWGHPPAPGSRSVDVLVRRLRRKVDEGDASFTYIQTDAGAGYRMQAMARTIRPA